MQPFALVTASALKLFLLAEQAFGELLEVRLVIIMYRGLVIDWRVKTQGKPTDLPGNITTLVDLGNQNGNLALDHYI